MRVQELASRLGPAILRIEMDGGTIEVPVEVVDARVSWGRVDLQVVPEGGNGSAWVSEGRVRRPPNPLG